MTTVEITGGTVVVNSTIYNSINYVASHTGDVVTIYNSKATRDIICQGPYSDLTLMGVATAASASEFVANFNQLVNEQTNQEPTEIRSSNGQAINAMPWRAEVVVPSATTILARGVLYIGTGGDILVCPAGQSDFVLFKNIPDGSFFPVHVIAVSDDPATTALDMLICY